MICRMVVVALAIALLPICNPVVAQSSPGNPQEAELAQIDLEQARIVQSGEMEALRTLLHPQYAAHLTNGQLAGYDQMLSMIVSGQLAKEKFRRSHKKVMLIGDAGVVMGVDILEKSPPLARNGEKTRHYTNIYVRQSGRWRLFARHFHLLP